MDRSARLDGVAAPCARKFTLSLGGSRFLETFGDPRAQLVRPPKSWAGPSEPSLTPDHASETSSASISSENREPRGSHPLVHELGRDELRAAIAVITRALVATYDARRGARTCANAPRSVESFGCSRVMRPSNLVANALHRQVVSRRIPAPEMA
jgi:hypothetical protein